MWILFDKSDAAAVAQLDAFVSSHPSGHFMQTGAWAAVKSFWEWRGLCVLRKHRVVASAGVLIRRLPLGFSLLYIPRGPVCDRNDPLIWYELMDGLRHLARQQRSILLHIDPAEPDENTAFRTLMGELGFTEKTDEGFGGIQPQYVFRLDLKGRSREDIFKGFSGKTRYNIGLSLRKGVVLQEYTGLDSIPDAVFRDFYTLMETTGARDGFFIRDLPYFQRLMYALKGNACLFVAYYQSRPIAGSIEIFCGGKAWYLYGASANEHRNLMPNYLLQWTMLQRAMDRGCEVYDFRGVPGVPSEGHPLYGLYRFKKGFGGTYTKFTGLFTYTFLPLHAKLLRLAADLRRRLRPRTRKPR